MHQTFYIDVDEEITSVVERLRKGKANEIIMVVPKRALLIQSIVNLRLLKKEAENLGVQLMIVTQDKLGKLLVEKAGILVQQKLDETLENETIVPASPAGSYTERNLPPASNEIIGNQTKGRLDRLGSESYFSELSQPSLPTKGPAEIYPKKESKPSAEVIIGKELVTGIGSDIKRLPKNIPPVAKEEEMSQSNFMLPSVRKKDYMSYPPKNNLDDSKVNGVFSGQKGQDNKIEHFFYNSNFSNPGSQEKIEQPKTDRKYSEGFKKIALIALAVIAAGALLWGAYLFIPKANIKLTVKQKTQSQDFNITGSTTANSSDAEKGAIPARLISVTSEVTKDFPASGGAKNVSGQKARGTITIYNEYSSASQPLVATTRFLSEDGKVFRLTDGVTVPGTNNGKPGQIDAAVVADQSGEDYNIGAGKFSIPGFSSSGEKHDKIYGVSNNSMSGGGGSGGGQAKTITQGDINNAKDKINLGINDDITQKIKDSSGSDAVVLSEAINKGDAVYKISNSVGDAADNFQVTLSVKASALVFDQNDLKNIVSATMARSGGAKTKIDGSSMTLDYGKADVDFTKEAINIKGRAVTQLNTDLDINGFKKDVLGKNNDEFESMLGNYPDVIKAEINYWPPFISWKIPSLESRVDVQIEYES